MRYTLYSLTWSIIFYKDVTILPYVSRTFTIEKTNKTDLEYLQKLYKSNKIGLSHSIDELFILITGSTQEEQTPPTNNSGGDTNQGTGVVTEQKVSKESENAILNYPDGIYVNDKTEAIKKLDEGLLKTNNLITEMKGDVNSISVKIDEIRSKLRTVEEDAKASDQVLVNRFNTVDEDIEGMNRTYQTLEKRYTNDVKNLETKYTELLNRIVSLGESETELPTIELPNYDVDIENLESLLYEQDQLLTLLTKDLQSMSILMEEQARTVSKDIKQAKDEILLDVINRLATDLDTFKKGFSQKVTYYNLDGTVEPNVKVLNTIINATDGDWSVSYPNVGFTKILGIYVTGVNTGTAAADRRLVSIQDDTKATTQLTGKMMSATSAGLLAAMSMVAGSGKLYLTIVGV